MCFPAHLKALPFRHSYVNGARHFMLFMIYSVYTLPTVAIVNTNGLLNGLLKKLY